MAPFRAKIGRRRLRKGENKNYRFVPFLPDAEQKMQKKKIKKIKKYHYGIISTQNSLEKAKKERENKNYRVVTFLLDA